MTTGRLIELIEILKSVYANPDHQKWFDGSHSSHLTFELNNVLSLLIIRVLNREWCARYWCYCKMIKNSVDLIFRHRSAANGVKRTTEKKANDIKIWIMALIVAFWKLSVKKIESHSGGLDACWNVYKRLNVVIFSRNMENIIISDVYRCVW